MICFQAYIEEKTICFLRANLKNYKVFKDANIMFEKECGILNFFKSEEEFFELKNKTQEHSSMVEEPDRRAYGDFQTNDDLAEKTILYLYKKNVRPELVVEPTCGKGSFVMAVLKKFKKIKKIIGVEIYYPYVWQTKFKILDFYLKNKEEYKPQVEIIHANVFDFSFEDLAKKNLKLKTLIIGNPPWVTNSELGAINSNNLPKKSNFKKLNGIDAITGKGNFDIGEYISTLMLRSFDKNDGILAFLVKNSVVKNIIFDQKRANHHIGNIEILNIDAKKEFNVSVGACLFISKLNCEPEMTCQAIDFYSLKKQTQYGWYKNKFVYSISKYGKVENIDGKCQFTWRQGVKHDCSKIMELDKLNGHFINGYKKEVELEKDLLHGLLKSSDLKEREIKKYRKTTIITQRKVGQDTSYIKRDYPKTFAYLYRNKEYFERRKSSIYRGKPPYSIFGIGDYSFASYKIAISGMYKRTTFSLVYPEHKKPLMLDDTCYFIGFDNWKDAKIAQYLLNTEIVQNFLEAIIFPDSKRSITKDILMRINLKKVFDLIDNSKPFQELIENIAIEDWNSFGKKLEKNINPSNQIVLF